ncbi:MAG TPA: TolC family protein, partial [Gemmatimonadales bacterium]
MRWTIGVAGLLIAARAAAQQPGDSMPTVTLDDAVQRALQVQPAMVTALGNERNASAGKLAAYGAFLPNFSVNSGATRSNRARLDPSNRNNTFPPIYNFNSGFSANLNLFLGFRRIAGLKSASASEDAAQAGFVNQQFQTTLSTKQAFFAAIANDELVKVAEAQVARTQQQLRVATDKLRAGAGTRSDSLTAAVDYGNAQVALLQAQANLDGARATLGRQIGIDGPVRPVMDSVLPAMPDTAAVRASAIENSPQVQSADAQVRVAQAGVAVARAQYLPTFSVSFSDGRSDTTFGGGFVHQETFQWNFGVNLTLFNGFTREQSQTSARVARDIAAATAADTRRSVSAQMTQQIASLGAAYSQVTISQSSVASATEAYRVQTERYRVGAAVILDLLTAE